MSEKGCIKCGARDTGQKEVAMTGTAYRKYLISSIIRLSLSFVKNADIRNSIIKNHRNLPISLICFLDDDKRKS